MKNIRTYNTFINESLRNKLKGKSEDEIDKIINYDRPRDSFYLSIRYGYMKGVKISLSKFDNDLSVDRLNSGLDIAVGYNQFHIAKLLIDLGADASNTEYYDMLVNATIQRNYDMVKLLIDNGTDPVDEEWENALYNAAHNNDIDIVKLLLKHSKGKDIVSSNLINDIKRKGYNDIHKLLIRFNALPTNESLKDKIKGKTDDEIKNKLKDLTPKEQLRLAVKYNYLDIIKNIHTLPSFNKLTLKNSLIESIGLDHYEIAKYLFDIGVPLDVKDYNDPLNYFYKKGDIDIVKDILFETLVTADEWYFEKFVVDVVKNNDIELFEYATKWTYDRMFYKYLLKIAKHYSSEEMISVIKKKKRSL